MSDGTRLRPVRGPLVPSAGSPKAASATGLSKIDALLTVPRSCALPAVASVQLLPALMASAAAWASASVGNTACWTARFSGCPKLLSGSAS